MRRPHLALALTLASLASAQSTRYLFSFGDSYSSTGFDPKSTKPSRDAPLGNPTYPGITSCGGPSWVGVVAHDLAPPGTLSYNFAHPGATINNSVTGTSPDMVTQVGVEFGDEIAARPSYARWTGENSVFVTWFGINDIDRTYRRFERTYSILDTRLLDTYFEQLDRLFEFGARRFVVLTVPPIERTPSFNRALKNNQLAIGGQLLVSTSVANIRRWNRILRQRATAWRDANPDITSLSIVETKPIFDGILDHPTSYGAPNSACHSYSGVTCLWWDDFHPGQRIQRALGEAVHAELEDSGFYNATS